MLCVLQVWLLEVEVMVLKILVHSCTSPKEQTRHFDYSDAVISWCHLTLMSQLGYMLKKLPTILCRIDLAQKDQYRQSILMN